MKPLYKSELGVDKPIHNFRHWKKALKRQGPINSSQVNKLRRRYLVIHQGNGTKSNTKVQILGFQTTYYSFGGLTHMIVLRYLKYDFVTSCHPGDYLMYGDRHNSNYFSKD